MTDLNLMATNIKLELEKVDGINQAFSYEPQAISNLPAATVYFDGFTQNEQTTRRKTVNWRWAIRIYVPIRGSDIEAPQIEVRNLIMGAMKQLNSNSSLSGTCLYHTMSSGDTFTALEQNNPLLIAELTLEATTEE